MSQACLYHPQVAGKWRCRSCDTVVCGGCVRVDYVAGLKRVELCPRCGGGCEPADLRKPAVQKPFLTELPLAFAYPVRGRGKFILIFGTALLAIASFAATYGWVFGAVLWLIINAYMAAYAFKIIAETGSGADEPPDFPELSNFWDDVVKPFFLMLFTFVIAFVPVLVLLVVLLVGIVSGARWADAGSSDTAAVVDDGDDDRADDAPAVAPPAAPPAPVKPPVAAPPQRAARIEPAAKDKADDSSIPRGWGIAMIVLSVLGLLYLPMALMSTALWGTMAGLNPARVVVGILRIGPVYLLACLMMGAIYAAVWFFSATKIPVPVVGPLVGSALSVYLMLAEMRICGLLYRSFENKLGWFV
jgi:hypothetical protein